jgi:hypothetical protein
MKRPIYILSAILTLGLTSCTDNQMARKFGGTETISLPPGIRLENITWKDDQLWLLTSPDTTQPTTYTLQEKSSWGVIEGQVVIQEQ